MQRPRIVTLIGWLTLLYGLWLLAFFALLLVMLFGVSRELIPPEISISFQQSGLLTLLSGGQLVLGFFFVASGIGVLRLQSWAWLLAMVVNGVNLIIQLIDYFRDQPHYAHMLISTAFVFLLNLDEVQRTFSLAQHRTEPDSLRTAQADAAAASEAQARLSRQ